MTAAKPEFIVHIGQSKTGTSSIQRVLGGQRKALEQLGICYPLSPGWANHGMLPASLVPLSRLGHFNPALWDGIGAEARLAQFRREFAAEMAALPAGTRLVILSAEQCGGLLGNQAEIARLRDLLAPHASRIRIAIYLRRQDQHAASGYTQGLRVAGIRPPELPKLGPDRLPQYDYAKLLDDWAAVFGADAMMIRIFERAEMVHGDAVDDFLDLCGVPLAVPADHPDRQSNLSLTPAAIDLARSMGERMKARPEGLSAASLPWRRFMAALSDALPGRGWKPHPAEAAAFLARYAEVNEAVRRRWFPDRPSLFAPLEPAAVDPSQGPPPGPPPIDRGAALEAAMDLLEDQLGRAAQREADQHVLAGRLHERLGEQGPARNAFRAALRAVPDHPLAQQHLAEAALREGNRTAAEAHLAVLRRAHPAHAATQRIERLMAAPKPGG
ncbi:tetratricopeptide repeat protein [Falsiroseomonas sp.]|uniref:tetratricopeptide repeat protein n=1 Tax=Falsiroseomonas sp. TaxID=2870721 RepID=UPI003F6FDC29